mgnify:FL=1
MNIKNITTLIENEKPNLKPTSIKQYVRCIKTLHNKILGENTETDNYDFLKDPEKLKIHLSEYHFTTARNYYTAVITLLETEEPRDKDTIKVYENIVKESNDNYKKQNETGIISVKQSDNFVSVDKIDKLISILKDKNEIGYIIFSILKHHHIRNEIATLQVIKLMDYKKLQVLEKKDNNYMVVGTKKLFIARNGYKTNKTYGEITFDITDKLLIKDIRKYIKGLDSNEMFPFPDTNGGKKQQLSNLMSYLSDKYIGVKISTTLLAKIMLSHKHLDTKLAQEKSSSERGHSVSVMNSVYIKQPDALSE